ncbi:MAG TPA: WXG100 family type VII secretion target [Chitinispirillaceae bacterium]|nr:WXG100 family type VII secretion target [Chitinispirillaceae bacterium]
MTDILIRPPELRQAAEQLRSSAQKIGQALQAIDNDINTLKGDHFLGKRATALQAHYTVKRDALLRARELVMHFSTDLKLAADTFEKADHIENNNSLENEGKVVYASRFPFFIFPTHPKLMVPEYKVATDVEAKYGEYLRKYSEQYGVPYQYLLNVIVKERIDYGMFGESKDMWGKFTDSKTVSLGLAQIEIRRAAELEQPGRNFDAQPLTKNEINRYEKILENPEDNIRILSMELADNYDHYGKIPGKTEEDRWCFAIAKHKSGHGPISEAQETARMDGKDLNNWKSVSSYLSNEISGFVEFVRSYTPLPPGTTIA